MSIATLFPCSKTKPNTTRSLDMAGGRPGVAAVHCRLLVSEEPTGRRRRRSRPRRLSGGLLERST
jgi:hypothetical protein